MDVEVRIVGDMLKGDEVHELRLKLKEHRNEEFPYKDDEWLNKGIKQACWILQALYKCFCICVLSHVQGEF